MHIIKKCFNIFYSNSCSSEKYEYDFKHLISVRISLNVWIMYVNAYRLIYSQEFYIYLFFHCIYFMFVTELISLFCVFLNRERKLYNWFKMTNCSFIFNLNIDVVVLRFLISSPRYNCSECSNCFVSNRSIHHY